MSSCWRAMNHDTSEPSTLNMCNAILNKQLQYLPNPSHPIASPWKPYWARPIPELQATQNGLSTTSSVPHSHTKWNCNWKQLLFFRHDSWTPPLGGFSRIWYAFNQWLQHWQSGKADHVSDYHFTFWLCGINDALPEKNWEHCGV